MSPFENAPEKEQKNLPQTHSDICYSETLILDNAKIHKKFRIGSAYEKFLNFLVFLQKSNNSNY